MDPLAVSGVIIGVAGAIIGVVGTLITVRIRNHRRLHWSNIEDVILDSPTALTENIQVFYNGEEVPNVATSRLAIWNAGTTTIGSEDLKTAQRLCLKSAKDALILDANIINATGGAQGGKVELTENEWQLAFDFIDAREGMIVEVVHTRSEEPPSVSLAGRLRGAGEPKQQNLSTTERQHGRFRYPAWPASKQVAGLIMIVVVFGFYCFLVFSINVWAAVILAVLGTIVVLQVTWTLVPRVPQSLRMQDKQPGGHAPGVSDQARPEES